MNGYITDIEKETIENDNYRQVLYTGNYSQLVLMSIEPGDEIGAEVHGLDQFIRLEKGSGKAVLDGEKHDLKADHAVVIPAGTEHNVVNTGEETMKLYSIYSPPEHKEGTIHENKADEREEHFDGETTE